MRHSPRTRFWVETVLALVTAGLFVLTLLQPQWIEALFEVEPDGGSGALEWALVGVFFLASVLSSLAARAEWRRSLRPAG